MSRTRVRHRWVNDGDTFINELLSGLVINQNGVADWPLFTFDGGDDFDFHNAKNPNLKVGTR